MKTAILAFLFFAIASASFLDFKPTNLNLLMQESLKKIDVKFNSTEFWGGFNTQLGLVSNEEAEACVASAILTLLSLHGQTQLIASLQWDTAFYLSSIAAGVIANFPTYCQVPYTAYKNYFGEAVEAAGEDFEVFVKQVFENWSEGDMSTITNLTNLIEFVLENNDKGAGEAFANLVNIGLSSYLPSNATSQVVY